MNKSGRPIKKRISKSDADNINLRLNIIKSKKQQILVLENETQLLQNELDTFSDNIFKKYKLSKNKKFIFDGTYFIEE